MRLDFEEIWKFTLRVMVVLLFLFFTLWSFSSKRHCGYYLSDYNGEYRIMINWENSPDDSAFRTYSEEEALKTFERLQRNYREQLECPK